MYKKQLLLILLCFTVFLGFSSCLLAMETTHVKDQLGFFTAKELQNLEAMIEEVRSDYNFDTVIVTIDDTQGKSSRDFADDYFDYGGYGIGEERSGILLLINGKEREVWLSTRGKGLDFFPQNEIDTQVEKLVSYLGDSEDENARYNGCKNFIENVKSICRRNTLSYGGKVLVLLKSPFTYIIAFIVAFIVTLVKTLGSKGCVTVNHLTYEEDKGLKLTHRKDNYLREHTTRIKLEKQDKNNGSSGGGTHRSSSGATHGGGGGKF
ncbi:hypothetical protein CS063_00260 [Sporanaerobium hydrogeniformans]|uniref:Uncharacterized protein n=1 Tax=Sporanaerobium hydrogeniformans TaxID=3072179 RepID=A0AC61DFA7_9FIRM|nr:TPM domain-containing protein [Sporanaerobium hydrogeniformans]PHV71944.1 hypothetical protein CS063_00260 [Sporanaerobium hydrogeniformans]